MSAETQESVPEVSILNEAWIEADRLFHKYPYDTQTVREGTYVYLSPIKGTNPTQVRFVHATCADSSETPSHSFELFVEKNGQHETLDYIHVNVGQDGEKIIHSNILENEDKFITGKDTSTPIKSDVVTKQDDIVEISNGLHIMDMKIQLQPQVRVSSLSQNKANSPIETIEAIIEKYATQKKTRSYQWETDENHFVLTTTYDKETHVRSVQLSKSNEQFKKGAVVSKHEVWTFRSDLESPLYSSDQQTQSNVLLFERPVKGRSVAKIIKPANIHTELKAGTRGFSAKMKEGLTLLRAAA